MTFDCSLTCAFSRSGNRNTWSSTSHSAVSCVRTPLHFSAGRFLIRRGAAVSFLWESIPVAEVIKNLHRNGSVSGFGGPVGAPPGNAIPYLEHSRADAKGFVEYLRFLWLGRGWVHISHGLRDAIAGKVSEVYLNAFEHGRLAILRREPDLIAPGEITFAAHALVVPSSDPDDIEQHAADVELVAVKIAQAFEEAVGAIVRDIHTPELARAARLPDNPGFDLLAIRPGSEKRAIEVKGRAATGDIEVSSNEWAKPCNMRLGYWLYAVYDCATPAPRLVRVQDPFGNLLAKTKGSVLIGAAQVLAASNEE